MTEHLPECPMQTKDSICRCLPCICVRLRDCEKRVASEFLTPASLAATGMEDPRYAKGYAAALDAVQVAVYKVKLRPVVARPLMFRRADVLFALDALKGDQS